MDKNYLFRIKRFIDGQADNYDREFVESLMAEGKNNAFLMELIKNDWDSIITDPVDEFNSTALLDSIHQRILKNEPVKKLKPVNRLVRIYMKVAAILLIPVLFSGLFFLSKAKNANPNSSLLSVYAPLGSRVSFDLPDGTKGMLNGGSKLKYTIPFESRKVSLDGEAWFSVKHDELHPFRILANESRIEVLGTKLNVSAYQEEKFLEVILQEGKVDFYPDNESEKISLKPSERLVLLNGVMQKSFIDTAKYTSWTTGKLVFRGDNMHEVAKRIERWYNVKVNIADKELNKYSFRATFQDDSIEEVIRCLALTSPVKYEIIPGKLLENGIYQKTEVIISKSK